MGDHQSQSDSRSTFSLERPLARCGTVALRRSFFLCGFFLCALFLSGCQSRHATQSTWNHLRDMKSERIGLTGNFFHLRAHRSEIGTFELLKGGVNVEQMFTSIGAVIGPWDFDGLKTTWKLLALE